MESEVKLVSEKQDPKFDVPTVVSNCRVVGRDFNEANNPNSRLKCIGWGYLVVIAGKTNQWVSEDWLKKVHDAEPFTGKSLELTME